MKIPKLLYPRFRLANRAAQAVLNELGNPVPPIPVKKYIESKGWEIIKTELGGPDGAMLKLTYKSRTKFNIYVATDVEEDSPYENDTMEKRRFFTLAHELGHVLLHNNFLLDSSKKSELPENIASILEVEAHWFASRVLMPNYVFQSAIDLIPEVLAEKCAVNLTPAQKRLNYLDADIRRSLISTIRLDKYPANHLDVLANVVPDELIIKRQDKWESFEEAASQSALLYMCSKCGLLHNEWFLFGRSCLECGGLLVNTSGIQY